MSEEDFFVDTADVVKCDDYDNKVDIKTDVDGNCVSARPFFKVRLDKWLWAARFFKTCALARVAVEEGNVLYNNVKVKANIEVDLGATVEIYNNNIIKVVIIMCLASRRKSFSNTSKLFKIVKVKDLHKIAQETSYHPYKDYYYNSNNPYANNLIKTRC